MNKQKEISATEKLLDFIRTQPDSPEEQDDGAHNKVNAPIDLDLEPVLSMVEDKEPASAPPTPAPHPSPPKQPPEVRKAETIKEPEPVNHANSPDQKIIEEKAPTPNPIHFTPPPKKKGLFSINHNLFSRVKIGVDIQDNCINLAKIQITGGSKKLLSCQSVPFFIEGDEEKSLINDQIFKGILSQALASFCPPHKKPEIWCSYSASKTTKHNVVIPKVGEKELANAVYWSVKKEVDFNEKTTKFDFSILKEITKGEQSKILVLATLTPAAEISAMRSLFNDLGYPLSGITSQATAVHNLLQQDHTPDKATASIHLTMDTDNSSLDLFFQDKMLFSREIKTGVDSFIESVLDQAQGLGVVLDEDNAKNYVFCPAATNDESSEKPAENNFFEDLPIAELKVIERLIRQLSRTFEYCTTHFAIPRVAELYTSGETVLNDTILHQIENKLGIKCSRLDHSHSQIILPESQGNAPKPEHLIALGLALSKNASTTNSIFTYADRAAEKTAVKINQIISIVTIVLALTCGGIFAFQYHELRGEKQNYNQLSAELSDKYQNFPRTRSTTSAINSINKIKSAQKANRDKVIRFQTIAILSRLSSAIPADIKLTSLSLQAGNKKSSSKGSKKDKKGQKDYQKRIRLKGFVKASNSSQEFALLQFLKQLSRLDFAAPAKLQSSRQTEYNGKEILTFKINLPIQLVK